MMGRVTQGMMNTQLLRNLNNNLSKMSHYQDQVATGRKLNKPSDDPVGLSFAMRYRSDITANEQYQENISTAISWLEFTDTLMEQAGSAFHRIRELTVQGANGSNPKGALDAIKSEILELSDQLVTIGNSQFNGKYVYNGQITDVPPYKKGISEVPLAISVGGTVDVNAADVTANNNQLRLIINRGQEVTVTLPPKDYAAEGGAAAFATDLQDAIHAAVGGTNKVTVTADAENKLVIRSTDGSPNAGIQITGGSLAVNWMSESRDLKDLVKVDNPASNVKLYHIEAQHSTTDHGDIYFEIATGVRMPVNITGDKVFGHPSDGDNVFNVLSQIINALDKQDTGQVSELLGKLDSRMNTFLEVRADLGAKLNRIQLSEERLKDIDLNLKELQNQTEYADVAELITTLKTYESVYQASLSVGAKIISPSLVDFLR
ncbi:flagellar hook-associated protein FlgL [Paenibacillus sp. YYML68]|uniref:flagellar hook-associated protein FlgL n=1 Tax=Paenibacillus sp. YYML68 TaxID=2909250 RepID=UPI00248FFC9D|nr:flagellar hook-associated protein FlgL [Paenibacillus sp. YYML68]